MLKRDSLLKGWDLELDKDSENYKKMKALLQEFEKEYIRQKQQPKIYSFPFIQYTFHPGPSAPLI